MRPTDVDVHNLLTRVKAQDPEALGELYDQYCGLLFGLVCRILHDRSDAEEVLQEVFVQAWTRAASYDPALGSPGSWLVGIARNRAIDRLRANTVRFRKLEAAPHSASAGTPESLAARTERQQEIHGALDALPWEQRELIERAYFLGSTQSEMAAHFDLPLGTVKGRVRTGLASLRSILQASPSER